MANIDLNVSPYFDDFDPNKDFLRVLFRPGFPVQARELTTLQSILQEQIKRFGDHVFKQGSRVTGARINFDKSANRMLLSGSNNSSFPISGARTNATLSNIEDFIGLTISNADGSVKAKVLTSPQGINESINTGQIFIKYISANKFSASGDYIYATVADNSSLTSEIYNTYSELTECSLAHIEEGVFYVSDFFTRVAAQTIIVDSKSTTPSVKLGFTIESSLIEPSTDNTLFDNARGSTNEGAPGAHRLTNVLKFGIRSIDENTDSTFFSVLTIGDGIVQERPTQNPVYDELGKMLAQRTFDESGDYAVDPLVLTNSSTDSDQNFLMSYDSGKVYVRGNSIEVLQRKNIINSKPLTFERVSNKTVSIPGVPKVKVDILDSSELPGFGSGDTHLHAQRLNLQDSDNNTIGVARAWGYENSPAGSDYLHMYDIKMFQQLDLDRGFDAGQGGDIKTTSNTRGIQYTLENTGDLNKDYDSDIRVLVHDFNRPFQVGQTITSSTKTSATAEIVSVTTFDFSDVKQIRGASGTFHAEVKSNLENIDGKLLSEVPDVLKTSREGSNVLDNNFNVLYQNPPTIVGTQGGISVTPDETDTIFSTASENGNYTKTRIDDADEIGKTLKFAVIKVRNPGSSRSSSINYGWTTNDKQINLLYPDAHRVYGIVNGETNNEFSHFKQINITVTGGGAIPQGSIVTGLQSGTKAIVALTNGAKQEEELSTTNGYHTSRKGTGNDSVIEIVITKGTEFKANESLKVETPADQDDFVNAVVYNATRGEVVNDTTEDFGYDVSANYLFDNGQRDYYYDISRIERKNNVPAPTSGDLTIFFSYLEADPINKFFYNVDSYASLGFFKEDARMFDTPQEIKDVDLLEGINLRNVVDFRLRANNNTNTGQNAFSFAHRTFKNQSHLLPGSAVTSTNPESKFVFDYDRYLPRKDSVYINSVGEIVIVKGNPSVNPAKPDAVADAMLLNDLTIPAAVRYPSSEIEVEVKDNRRYTMRDIGDIEKRIDRLEKAVSLSMLESQALHDNIDDRTKLGFIVDDFKDINNTIADASATTAISASDGTLRPFTVRKDDVKIEVIDPSTTALTSNNIDPFYFNNGFITKGYTQYPLSTDPEWLTQPKASSSVKINPYATWIYQGRMSIVPNRDIVREPRRVSGFAIDRTGSANDSDVSREEFFRSVEPVNVGQPWLGNVFDWGGQFRVGRRIFQRTRRNTFQTQIVTRDSAANFQSRGVAENTEAFIRSQRITISVEGMRPNVALKALFNGEDVTSFIAPASDSNAATPNYVIDNRGTLSTNADGNFKAAFDVPSQRFPTGAIALVLTDLDNANTTNASATFTARNEFEFGVLSRFRSETRVNTVVDSSNWGRFIRWAGDPIAQTFMLPISQNPGSFNPNINQPVEREDAFVTSIDIYFDFVDVDQPDVIAEIRNVVNGYPGPEIIGQAVVTVPASASSTNASVATNFRFDAPVYLEGDKEYCIVLLTASPNTSVWTAVQGETDITSGTGGLIDSQPNVGGFFGSFFKSQNASTWTAEQNTDLKFKIYKANFNLNKSVLKLGNVISNKEAPIGAASNGLAIRTFKHSNYVQISHPNHGMYSPNDQVCLHSVTGINGKIGGIPVSEINNAFTGNYEFTDTHAVLFATQDSYFIKVKTHATNDDVGGGTTAHATQNTQYDSLNLRSVSRIFGSNTIDAKVKTTSGSSLEQVVKSQIVSNDTNSEFYNVAGVKGEFVEANVNDLTYFDTPKIIRNKNNTSVRDLEVEFTLNSTDSKISPVMVLSNTERNEFWEVVVDRNRTADLLDDSDVAEFYPVFDQKTANDSDLLTVADSDNDTTLRQFSSYISAVQSTDEHSDFVTQTIDLETPADMINIFFDADMNPGNEIEIAFKAKRVGDNKNINDQAWEDFKLDTFINETNYDSFKSGEDFRQYDAEHNVGEFYDQLKIRIRFRSKNEAQPPRIKDLRIIANA